MKHSTQIITFLSTKPAYGSMPLEPAETRPRSNFPDSKVAFQGTISYAKHRRNVFMAGTEYFGGNAVQPRYPILANTMRKTYNHTLSRH